ncbi:hemicentin-1-like [Mytilus galloprovincialis]|uniref:hemicentin-1-like n=1 Tax=Mytilus galloprovincialis TaxID=29158 RepID=UPI003F7BC878
MYPREGGRPNQSQEEDPLNITSDSPGVYGSKVTDPSLTILHVTAEDSGDYICFAVNIVGTGNSEPTSLTVLGVLNITSDSPGVYGSKVTDPSLTILHVTAEDSGDYICFAVNIVGTGNSEPTSLTVLGVLNITSDSPGVYGSKVTDPSLTILHVTADDSGDYICFAVNIVGTGNSEPTSLTVLGVLNITSDSPGVYGSKVTDPSLTILHVTAEDSGDYICFAVNIVGTGNSEPTSLTVLGVLNITSDSPGVYGSKVTDPSLTILHVTAEDSGDYICFAVNIVGTGNSEPTSLTVLGVLNITSDSPGVYGSKVTDPSLTILHVTAEDSGDYICFAVNIVGTGNSEPTSLTVLGVLNITSDSPGVYGSKVTDPSLTILHVTAEDSGDYICFAVNIVGTGNSEPTSLTVLGVLNITSDSPGVYGSKVTDPSLTILHVTAEDSGDYICFAVNIVGTGNSEPTSLTVLGVLNITCDSPGVYGSKVTDPSLTILHVTAEDSGDYICFAVNIVGTGNSEPTSLTVLGVLNITSDSPGVYGSKVTDPSLTILHVTAEDSGDYICFAVNIVGTGNSEPTILNITSDSPGVYGSKVTDPSLTILHVTAEDSGDYICFAVNIVGTGNSEPTSLTVLGVLNITSDSPGVYGSKVTDPSLTILHVTAEDSGDYICFAVNIVGTGNSEPTSLTVLGVLNITSDSPGVYGSKVTDPSLTILHVTAEDSGDYICFAVNIVGTGNSEPTSLTVLGVLNITSDSPGVYGSKVTDPSLTILHVTAEDSGDYICFAVNIVGTGNSEPTSLTVLGVLNITCDSPGVYGSKVTDPSLTILHVTAQDSGDYICFAVNIVGTGNSEPTSLTVLGVLNITSDSPGVYGSKVTDPSLTILHVTAEDSGDYICFAVNIVGTGNSEPTSLTVLRVLNITCDSPGVYGSKVTDPSLTILHVTAEDSGDYICFAVNIVGTGNSEPTSLTVLGVLNITSDSPGVYGSKVTDPSLTILHVTAEDSGDYICFAVNIVGTGNSEPTSLTVLRVLNITSDSPGVYGSKVTDPSLTILHVTAEDSGDYICFAVNIVGTGNSEPTSLTVLGVLNITSDSPGVYGSKVTDPSLTILHVTAEDSGDYICFAVNIVGTGNSEPTILNITSDRPGVYGSKVTDPSLTILHVTAEDSGDYICFAVNIVGTGNSEPTSLTVLGVLNITSDSPGVYGSKVTDPSLTILHVTAEDSGDYICFAVNIVGTGNSEPTSLTVLGVLNITSDSPGVYGSKVTDPSLTILHVTAEDSGDYICFAVNIVGTGNSEPTSLTVLGVLNITSDSPGVYGSKVTDPSLTILHVTAEDSGDYICFAVNIVGTGNSEPTSLTVLGVLNITSDSPGVYGSKVTDPSLTILHVTAEDSGDYICFAVNIVGTGNSEPTSLTVLGEQNDLVIKTEKDRYIVMYGMSLTLECSVHTARHSPVREPVVNVGYRISSIGYGEKVTLFCNFTAYPNVTRVYWEKEVNGAKNVINSWTVGIRGASVESPSLTIVKSTTADVGNYKCVATNVIGTGYSETISLKVIGSK